MYLNKKNLASPSNRLDFNSNLHTISAICILMLIISEGMALSLDKMAHNLCYFLDHNDEGSAKGQLDEMKRQGYSFKDISETLFRIITHEVCQEDICPVEVMKKSISFLFANYDDDKVCSFLAIKVDIIGPYFDSLHSWSQKPIECLVQMFLQECYEEDLFLKVGPHSCESKKTFDLMPYGYSLLLGLGIALAAKLLYDLSN